MGEDKVNNCEAVFEHAFNECMSEFLGAEFGTSQKNLQIYICMERKSKQRFITLLSEHLGWHRQRITQYINHAYFKKFYEKWPTEKKAEVFVELANTVKSELSAGESDLDADHLIETIIAQNNLLEYSEINYLNIEKLKQELRLELKKILARR